MIGDDWGKTTQEVAKTTGKAIGAAERVGSLFSSYIDGPLEQVSGLLTDRLQYARWERQMRLMARAEQFLKAEGVAAPNRKLAMRIGVPLIEAAPLEEDDDLHDGWAALLARAANAAADIEVKRIHVSLLAAPAAGELQDEAN